MYIFNMAENLYCLTKYLHTGVNDTVNCMFLSEGLVFKWLEFKNVNVYHIWQCDDGKQLRRVVFSYMCHDLVIKPNQKKHMRSLVQEKKKKHFTHSNHKHMIKNYT
jgi:hypothetical protein